MGVSEQRRIITRDEWGARPPRSRRYIETPTRELWLHHTAGADDANSNGVWWDDMRGIQNFHMDDRGWSDFAYSFGVGGGQVFEGRGFGVAGGHTKGHNSVSHAIVLIGNYELMEPTEEDLAAIAWLIREGRSLGMWGDLTGPHRDASGASTSCCGRNLIARIPDLRRMAAAPNQQSVDQEEEDMGNVIKALYALARGDGYDVTTRDATGFMYWMKVARETGPTWSAQAQALNTHMVPGLRKEAARRTGNAVPDIPL